MFMLNLAIIGCGRTGKRIGEEIIKDQDLSKNYFVKIFDFDKVEEKNIQSQNFSKRFLNIPKVKAFLEMHKNYESKFEVFNVKIEENNLKILEDCDIILNATDDFNLAILLNKFCVSHSKIFIHTAVSNNFAFISCTTKKPCLYCFSKNKSWSYEKPRIETILLCVSITLSFLRSLIKDKSIIGHSFFGDLENKVFNFLKIKPSRDCYVCSR